MGDRNPLEKKTVESFLKPIFGDLSHDIGSAEQAVVASILDAVKKQFSKAKYPLGLAIDFAVVAQQLAAVDARLNKFDKTLDFEAIKSRYDIVKERKDTKANTLTLRFGGVSAGIRSVEERLCAVFAATNRPGYPSAYVYNTGQWHKFEEMLVNCFRLSPSGRLSLCEALFDFAFASIPVNVYYGRPVPRVRVFERLIEEYPRSVPGENGGLVYQAIALGFFAADRPHLQIIADKVRTGSSRQRRFGDIDAYAGLDLEMSVEVKDFEIDLPNWEEHLLPFCNAVNDAGVQGIALVKDVEAQALEAISANGVIVLTQSDAVSIVSTWDWRKQNAALEGALHFLSHVEQNPSAVKRCLAFIKAHDSGHDLLSYYQT